MVIRVHFLTEISATSCGGLAGTLCPAGVDDRCVVRDAEELAVVLFLDVEVGSYGAGPAQGMRPQPAFLAWR
jgi:hypothetical protein